MAVSVLGKRSRQHEDVVAPSSPCKRRTRQSKLHIYEDEGSQDTRNRTPVTKSTASSTRTVQNRDQIPAAKSTKSNAPALPTSDNAAKENIPPSFSTPSAPRFKDVLLSSPSTPKHRVRLCGKPLTPHSRRTTSPKSQSIYGQARQLFTQGSDPVRLVGRDGERRQLFNFINNGIEARKGGCMYVSGPPGTGKSALVQELFQQFSQQQVVKMSVINCVTTRSSDEIFMKLGHDLDFATSTSGKRSKATFSNFFTSESKSNMHLVFLDEIDSLLNGDCELVYSIFEWAMHRSSSLLLIGVANALDLTDRFLPRLKTRGLKPQLLPFVPYSGVDMANIITQKLRSLLPADRVSDAGFVPFLHPAAIQLIGKKIASQTGDLRKSFNLARRTIDLIEQETMQKMSNVTQQSPTKHPLAELSNMTQSLPPSPPRSSPLKPASPGSIEPLTIESAPRASIAHVARLASTIFNSGTISRLAGLNLQQKAVLCSLVANETRKEARDPFKTPSKSAKKILTIKDLFERYARLCQRDDGLLQPLKTTEFRDVVASLETLGLIQESTGRTSGLFTPSRTPSRMGRNADERQVVSAVSTKEMQDSLQGPGADLLQRLFDEW